jgi:ribosomal protein S18 acetylase RimI-like enzyme
MAEIREMRKSDIPRLVDLFMQTWKQRPYNEEWTRETSEKRLKEIQDADFSFVLTEGKEIIGYGAANRFTWFDGLRLSIVDIVVREGHQGKGLGTLMLKHFEGICRKERMAGLDLLAHDGSRALDFYGRHGFRKTGWGLYIKDLNER